MVLDLTPNYEGSKPWFSDNNDEMVEKVSEVRVSQCLHLSEFHMLSSVALYQPNTFLLSSRRQQSTG